MIQKLTLGQLELYSLCDGEIWLDGGSMFGVVPKVLWSRLVPPDANNRVKLVLRPLLFKLQGYWVLIETGLDRKPGPKFQQIYGLSPQGLLLLQLAQLGLAPSDIDLVLHTHLHFDHAGQNTYWEDGRLMPTFSKARHIVQRQELHDAQNPHERNRASYLAENLEGIAFESIEGECEILPGLRSILLPGHTLGQQGFELNSEGQTLVYTADLLPTHWHLPLAYVMAFDLYPMLTLETRKLRYEQWLNSQAILALPHDPHMAFAQIAFDQNYTLRSL